MGNYKINPEIEKPKGAAKKKKQEKLEPRAKPTYLDEVIKHKKHIPSVGHYSAEKDHTEEIIKRYKVKNDKEKKQALLFRSTALDAAQVDTLKVAPGSYETSQVPLKLFSPLDTKVLLGQLAPSTNVQFLSPSSQVQWIISQFLSLMRLFRERSWQDPRAARVKILSDINPQPSTSR